MALPNLGEPRAARAMRLAARAWLATNDIPGENEEDWRYTDLRPFLKLPLTPASAKITD